MDVDINPQILLALTARFARVSWKYKSIAYATTLKNLGALLSNILSCGHVIESCGCAIGDGNINYFLN